MLSLFARPAAASLACTNFLETKSLSPDFLKEFTGNAKKSERAIKSILVRLYDIHNNSDFSQVPLPKKIKMWPGNKPSVSHFANSHVSTVVWFSHDALNETEAGDSSRLLEEVAHEIGHVLATETLHHLKINGNHHFRAHIEEMFSDFMEELISFEKTGILRDKTLGLDNYKGRTFTPAATSPMKSEGARLLNTRLRYGQIDEHKYTNNARLAVGRFILKSSQKGHSTEEIYSAVLRAFNTFVGELAKRESRSYIVYMKEILELNDLFTNILELE